MNDLTFSAFSYLFDDELNKSNEQPSKRLFTTTLDKTEEIQIKFNSVKSSLRQRLDSKTDLVKDFLPIIEATQKFEQLVENYWIYFEEKDKIQLENMACFILENMVCFNTPNIPQNNLYSILRKSVMSLISQPQLVLKNLRFSRKNQKNGKLLLNVLSAQLSLAETILDLRDQDKHMQLEEKKIVLSERDSQLLISLLENPPEPSEGLLSIFRDN